MILFVIAGNAGFFLFWFIFKAIVGGKKLNGRESKYTKKAYDEAYAQEMTRQKEKYQRQMEAVEATKLTLAEAENTLKEKQNRLDQSVASVDYGFLVPEYYKDPQILEELITLLTTGTAKDIPQALVMYEQQAYAQLEGELKQRLDKEAYYKTHVREEVEKRLHFEKTMYNIRGMQQDFEREKMEKTTASNRASEQEYRRDAEKYRKLRQQDNPYLTYEEK